MTQDSDLAFDKGISAELRCKEALTVSGTTCADKPSTQNNIPINTIILILYLIFL